MCVRQVEKRTISIDYLREIGSDKIKGMTAKPHANNDSAVISCGDSCVARVGIPTTSISHTTQRRGLDYATHVKTLNPGSPYSTF